MERGTTVAEVLRTLRVCAAVHSSSLDTITRRWRSPQTRAHNGDPSSYLCECSHMTEAVAMRITDSRAPDPNLGLAGWLQIS